jgi:hypothetical protein
VQSDNATEPYVHRAVACLVRRVQRAQGEALANLRPQRMVHHGGECMIENKKVEFRVDPKFAS